MKTTLKGATVALTVVALCVGCAPDAGRQAGSADDPPEAAAAIDQPSLDGEFMRGMLTAGDEVSFRPCAREAELPLRPLDAFVADLLEEMTATAKPVYAEFLGRPGGRVPGVTMTRLLHAATESPGCDAPEPDYRLRGHGNEPFWSIEVEADVATWRTPEEIDGVAFALDELDQVGAGWLLRAVTTAGRTLEASFAATPCRDSMADAWFGYTVEVRIDGRELRGCGRPGQAAR